MNSRMKARLKKLTMAIDDACERRSSEPGLLMMSLRVVTEQNEIRIVGRHDDQPFISVRIAYSCSVNILDSHRIGANLGDDFFELKLVPLLGSVVAPYDNPTNKETVFIKIEPIDIVALHPPKDVQRIIRLINAI